MFQYSISYHLTVLLKHKSKIVINGTHDIEELELKGDFNLILNNWRILKSFEKVVSGEVGLYIFSR